MKRYDPKSIEPKWQQIWADTRLYAAVDGDQTREKFYMLTEFPYPSGAGLHSGHAREYTLGDVISRHKRMQGYNVLYPMGYDAFGLPLENYAIKNKISPQKATADNVAAFRRQLVSLGYGVDWDREINTTDPSYYKWTQWLFLQFLKKGLAYQVEIPINWCPKEKTGLANEEVVNGLHERCGTPVEKKLLKQWMLKITAYADRLIEGLHGLDFPPRIADQQVNWIGRSEGAEIDFEVSGEKITVFTTRADTLAGATFLVLAPEHPAVAKITTDKRRAAVDAYVKKAQGESEVDRQETDREKTGVWTGATAKNPITGRDMPVWVADYVLAGYGTGAIMAVPAHDERDFEFVQIMNDEEDAGIEVILVIKPDLSKVSISGVVPEFPNGIPSVEKVQKFRFDQILVGEWFYTHEGPLIHSGQFDGLAGTEAKRAITKWLFEQGIGRGATKYKLRDWIFSRQHYWGEPIPVIHCANCGPVPVPDDRLPVTLPEVKHYEPTDTGESPLAAISDWVNVSCPQCGGPAKRETDTMPNWAGSSWYYLRYMDAHNDRAFAGRAKLDYWGRVDLYLGGTEHTTLHLLYSRFWHEFLYDQGLVPTQEPYAARRSQGIVLANDGRKMSKSWGNVVNPTDIIEQYGADALRLYILFMAPYDETTPWSDERLNGVSRFVWRAWGLAQELLENRAEITGANEENTGVFAAEVDRAVHKTLKKVHDDLHDLKFNTAVSALMELVNYLNGAETKARLLLPQNADLARRTLRVLVLMLAPLTPHLTEELWEQMGGEGSVHVAAWPSYDPALIKDDLVTIIVQVNGKLRATVIAPVDATEHQLTELAKADPNVARFLADGQIAKTIVVSRKLVNFVVK
jgi:leucyl-tRNA synthetase